MVNKRFPEILALLFFLALPSAAHAQRNNTVGTSVSLIGSVDDNPQVSGIRTVTDLERDFRMVYGVYPSIWLNSLGRASRLELKYDFGLNRVDSDLNLNSESHGASGFFETRLGRRANLSIANSFRKSPDFTTFNFFRGIVFTPDGVFFDFETVALRRDSYENTATVNVDYQTGARSYLEFGFGHSLGRFDEDPFFQQRLADQDRFLGSFHFRREMSRQTSWNVGYRAAHYDFRREFSDGRTHDMSVGLRHLLSPTVRLNASAGPSYTESLGGDGFNSFLGYHADFSVSKSFEDEVVTLSYRRENGTSVGIGSLSKAQRLGFGVTHSLGRDSTLKFGLSLYETQRIFDNPFETRGVDASLVWSYLLTQNVAISAGGSYRAQEGNDFLDFDRRRVFISLRFQAPDFWRF
jgi:hypothetical protein